MPMPDRVTAENFRIERTVLKDLSFETPMGQDVFTREWQPTYKIRLDLNSGAIAGGLWEVVLVATVTASVESEIAYLIEAQQAGVFEAKGLAKGSEELHRLLAIEAPRLIFPYLREAVDSVTAKAGFPSIGLQQPDFEAWYADAHRSGSSDQA